MWECAIVGYVQNSQIQANQAVRLGVNSQKDLQVSVMDNVRSLIFAWSEMKKCRRLLRWSRVSRGLVTEEEMRSMMDEDEARDPIAPDTPFQKELIPGVPDLVPCLCLNGLCSSHGGGNQNLAGPIKDFI